MGLCKIGDRCKKWVYMRLVRTNTCPCVCVVCACVFVCACVSVCACVFVYECVCVYGGILKRIFFKSCWPELGDTSIMNELNRDNKFEFSKWLHLVWVNCYFVRAKESVTGSPCIFKRGHPVISIQC